MRTFITGLLTIMTMATTAQSQKLCECSYQFKYPKKAVDSNISGKVIVEMDEDENGIRSNPIVVKGLGYGCDEEALRIANIGINCHNKCESRYRPQARRKVSQTFNFEFPPDDEPESKTNKNLLIRNVIEVKSRQINKLKPAASYRLYKLLHNYVSLK